MDSYLYLFYPEETSQSPNYKKILDHRNKIYGSVAYHMDWTFIFENILKWKQQNNNKIATILDVGCGNSNFHTFLEEYFKHGVIGIDRTDSTIDYEKFRNQGHNMVNAIDLCIDFINDGNKYFNNNADIVFWNSAIEHNDINKIKEAVEVSLNCLKKGGMFISTWAVGRKTFWLEDAIATILSKEDAEEVFNVQWLNEVNLDKARDQYLNNILGLREWHEKRFNHLDIKYFHAGNVIVK